MIDGKSRHGNRAWARLGPINTISSSASHVPRAGIANARRTRCQPRYATYRSEFLDPRWRGTRPPAGTPLRASSIALGILRSAGEIREEESSPRPPSGNCSRAGDEVARRHPLAQIESKSRSLTANGNSSEFGRIARSSVSSARVDASAKMSPRERAARWSLENAIHR